MKQRATAFEKVTERGNERDRVICEWQEKVKQLWAREDDAGALGIGGNGKGEVEQERGGFN